jgi:hypothetical protein
LEDDMKFSTRLLPLAALLLSACAAEHPAAQAATPVVATESAAEVSPAPAAPAAAASDDPITALCLDMMSKLSAETCACGTAAFRASTENADTYAEMAAHYLYKTAPEASRADRWDQVVAVVLADTPRNRLQISNALGQAHQDAIKTCEG